MFKDLIINSSADVNYTQSVTINEDEEKNYVGSWSYKVIAKEAEGSYMLQIQTN